jgi:hypothetical protein
MSRTSLRLSCVESRTNPIDQGFQGPKGVRRTEKRRPLRALDGGNQQSSGGGCGVQVSHVQTGRRARRGGQNIPRPGATLLRSPNGAVLGRQSGRALTRRRWWWSSKRGC